MIRRPIRPAKYSLDMELDDFKFCVVEFLCNIVPSDVIVYNGSKIEEVQSPIPPHSLFWTRDLKVYYNTEYSPVYAIHLFDNEVDWPVV